MQTSRRAEYAAATRQAIIAASRELFLAKGYVKTTVNEIARTARVAPATVYAVGGGKQDLLRTVIQDGTANLPCGPLFAASVGAAGEPDEVLQLVVHATREAFEAWADLMRVVTDTAPHEPAAAESLRVAQEGLRSGLALGARRLESLGALRLGVDQATDVLYYYLGTTSWSTLTGDNAWTLDRAERWLLVAVRTALL
ncbi:TetR/AcrR family transcriptional regulator [Catenuloplanes atrovinosus]|uniref:AcrR family transcriptional regulator n=1 Tax=Catenuloplanes atrovinosus TaxID=137266 RepID=A0AAE4C8D0_9ACTN|nr:TetR/AcrR family transcriptional regulator [Catenuloplanes atrovinosus]MDR7275396.1 AcrR family transcriptional regulator [Catenuloplanes atrovinosus]